MSDRYRWLHGDPAWETPTVEVDLRVGGRLRFVMRNPTAGEDYGASGEHTGTCRGLASEERRDADQAGWGACLDNLDRALERSRR
jgi:uncharacterized protein YndB with AHSA1/START domain